MVAVPSHTAIAVEATSQLPIACMVRAAAIGKSAVRVVPVLLPEKA